MSAEKRLPEALAVAQLLTMLVGKQAKVVRGTPLPAAAARGIATYVDAAGTLLFAAVADIAFIASVGAALAMIPRAIVDEAIKSGTPSGTLLENAYEVLNIASTVFNEVPDTSVHVKIQGLKLAPIPPELTKFVTVSKVRIDLTVSIAGYPDGKLTLVSAI